MQTGSAGVPGGVQVGIRGGGQCANRLRRCPTDPRSARRAPGERPYGPGCKSESGLPGKREMDALPEAGCPIPVRMIGNLAFLARRGALRAPAARSAVSRDTGEAGLHFPRTTRTGIMRGYLGRSGFAGCCGRLRGDNPKRRPVGAQARCPCRRCPSLRNPSRQPGPSWDRTACRRRPR